LFCFVVFSYCYSILSGWLEFCILFSKKENKSEQEVKNRNFDGWAKPNYSNIDVGRGEFSILKKEKS